MVTGSEDGGPAESRRILKRLSRESDHGGRSFVARRKYAAKEKGETPNGWVPCWLSRLSSGCCLTLHW
jgi:hypothetical protein